MIITQMAQTKVDIFMWGIRKGTVVNVTELKNNNQLM